jgi:hypothetical protein
MRKTGSKVFGENTIKHQNDQCTLEKIYPYLKGKNEAKSETDQGYTLLIFLQLYYLLLIFK